MKDNIINKYSGFFLIELLIALGILAMLFLGIFHFQVSISEQKYEAKKYNEALCILSSIIEEMSVKGLNNRDRLQVKDFKISTQDLYKKIFNPTEPKNIFVLKKMAISWKNLKGKKREISLVSGFIL